MLGLNYSLRIISHRAIIRYISAHIYLWKVLALENFLLRTANFDTFSHLVRTQPHFF